ncbi:MAG TPA: CHAT domain-containing protein [Acidobacteriota bacterium]|nr:CHAT domain-containing protein [Acidobacteriota bacterium]HQG90477.1 CHAT domain-containing protein [Acidobacteriota bacterium]
MRRNPMLSSGLRRAVCVVLVFGAGFAAGHQVSRETSGLRIAEAAALEHALCGEHAEAIRLLSTWIRHPETAHRASRLMAELEARSEKDLRGELSPADATLVGLHRGLLCAAPRSPERLVAFATTTPEFFYWDYELVRQLTPPASEQVRLLLRHLGPTANPYASLARDYFDGTAAMSRLPAITRPISIRQLDALAARAEILLQNERLGAARRAAWRTVEVATAIGDQWRAAEGRILLAQIALSDGDDEAAEHQLDAASRSLEKFPLPSVRRRRDCVRAMLRVRQGRVVEAASLFGAALASERDLQDRIHAAAMVNQGFVLDELGRSTEALQCYESGLEYYESRHDQTSAALVRLNRGALRERLNILEGAREDYEAVLRTETSGSAPALVALAQGNLGNIFARKRQWEKAEQCYRHAIAAAKESGEWARAGQIAGNLAIAQLAKQHVEAARISVRNARRWEARQPSPLGNYMIRGVTAHLLYAEGRLAEAENAFGSLAAELQDAGYRAMAWEMCFFQGKALAGQGRHEAALECFRRTMIEFDRLEQNCGGAEVQLHYLENCDEVVEASLASLLELMQRTSPPGRNEAEVFRLLESYRARVLFREMVDRHPTHTQSASGISLATVQTWLRKRSALALVIFQGVEAVYRLQLNGRDARLEKMAPAGRFQEIVKAAEGDQPEAEAARRSLAELLFVRDTVPELQRYRELFILPDGCLYRLPVELLPVILQDGRRLRVGEQWPVTYLPAWRFLAVGGSTEIDCSPGGGFLGIHGFSSGAAGRPGLPWAEREVRDAARTLRWPYFRLIAGREFARGIGQNNQAGQPWDIIHVATHIKTDETVPWESRIYLHAQGEQTVSISLSELQAARWQANLVVLSGCSSGRGRVFPGDGNVSLGRALLASGCRAVLLTLWPVHDRSAAAFMERFYLELPQHSGQVAIALCEARRWMRRDPVFQNPRHWGAYVLFGFPRPIRVAAVESAGQDLVCLLCLVILICILVVRMVLSSIVR